jgi:hypothetical protein
MSTRLLAFGCSHTFGWGLPMTETGPSKFAFPYLVAEKLGIECINNSWPGASNKEIWHTIMTSQDINTEDILLIHWTLHDRSCIIEKDNIIRFQAWNSDKLNKTYFKHIHSVADSIIDTNLRMQHIYNNFANNKQYHLIAKRSHYVKLKWNNVPLLDTDIYDMYGKYPLAEDNMHMGIQGHIKFAKIIYDKYLDN